MIETLSGLVTLMKSYGTTCFYYDPAVKIEKVSSRNPATKCRSQFRVIYNELVHMYYRHEYVELPIK